MNGLLLIERAVLEVLANSTKTLRQITKEMGLEQVLIKNTVKSLMLEGLISYNENGYTINQSRESVDKKKYLNDTTCIREEHLDIVEFTQDFNVVKLTLDSFEEKILQLHIKNFSDFIEGVQLGVHNNVKGRAGSTLKEKKVFAFGVANYGDILKKSISLS